MGGTRIGYGIEPAGETGRRSSRQLGFEVRQRTPALKMRPRKSITVVNMARPVSVGAIVNGTNPVMTEPAQ